MSTHRIDIIEIGDVLPHPNPSVERMELTHILGWQCCIGKGQFKKGDKAIYIDPDYLVPLTHPSFSFLKREDNAPFERIKVKKLQGTISQGLIIPVPDDLKHLPVGTNVIDQLGIQRYIPPAPLTAGGDFVSGPSGVYSPKFDLENFQRYPNSIAPGELVYVTEKINGASARYVFAENASNGEFEHFCGSRSNWMRRSELNYYWQGFFQTPGVADWCIANPDSVLYGEVFGNVKGFKYGTEEAKSQFHHKIVRFAAFAVLVKNNWMNTRDAIASTSKYGIPWVPVLYNGPFDLEKTKAIAEQDSVWPGAKHMSEGVVITPEIERTDAEIGRVSMKLVSNRYYSKG